ncbi:MAG: hypothetical protein KTR26_09310 [Flammeovirgaceae bacterium]|nr:hypothetical protein [Flammeovirgaceae bacterium]
MFRTGFREVIKCILLICLWQGAHSQSGYRSDYYLAKKFNNDDGLSKLCIYSILKDNDGFIWIGTDDGLNRFDGYQFEVFRHVNGDSSSIADNKVYSLCEDSKGRLWIGTNLGGLQLYNKHTKDFKSFIHSPDDTSSISNNTISSIIEGRDGYLWIGTNQGLNKFNPDTQTFTRFYKSDENTGLIGNEIRSVLETKDGKLWIGTQEGLTVMDKNTLLTRKYSHDIAIPNSLIHNSIFTLFNDSKGNIWIGTEGGGICRYDPENDSFQRKFGKNQANIPKDSNIVHSIEEDDLGNIWFSSWGSGIFIYESNKDKFSKIVFPQDNEVNSTIIYKFLNSGDGNMWVGTWEKGLHVLSKKKKAFRHVENFNSETSEIERIRVRTIFEDSERNIWFATDGAGLFKYIPPTDSYVHFFNDINDESTLSGKIVKPIIEDGDGFIYAGSYVNGLNKINMSTHEITRITHDPEDPNSLQNNNIWALCFDSQERIWVGTLGGGMDEYIPKENKFIHHYSDPDDTLTISSNNISKIFEDSKGNLWIGTIGSGICRMDREKRIFHRYQNKVTAESGVGFSEVIDIYEDKKNRLWISSNGGGLFLYNPETDKIEKSGVNHNLKGTILSILDDDEGNLWMGTFEGITKYNPESGTTISYNHHDGLQRSDFKSGSKLRSYTGEFYFGGSNGYNVFRPEEINDDIIFQPIAFTNLYLFHKKVNVNDLNSVLTSDINYQNRLVMDANQNTISFQYSSLDYTFSKLNYYAYMLEGFDPRWNKVGTERRATYTNLPPGEYTFKVKSSNMDGLWSDEYKSIEIIITPPFWQTLWFKIMVIAAIIAGFFSILWLRTRTIKQHNLKLEKLVNVRTISLKKANHTLYKEQQKVTQQNEELMAQQEELVTQQEELIAQTNKLELQTNILEETVERLKSTQSQLVHSEKMASIGMLTAGVAHEINNPINYIKSGIIGLKKALHDILGIMKMYKNLNPKNNIGEKLIEIEGLKSKLSIDKKVELSEKILNNITIGATKTAEIIKGLRTFSRMDDGNLSRYNIHDGLESTLLLLQHQVTDHIKVVKNYGHLPLVECYPAKLNQVFMNLISNAIQAINKKGVISITSGLISSTGDINEFVFIVIDDSGVGIEKDTLKHIFEPFFTTKKIGEGTGLGLSISQNIIDQHHGKIEVTSHLKKGTTFKIILPVRQKTPTEQTP